MPLSGTRLASIICIGLLCIVLFCLGVLPLQSDWSLSCDYGLEYDDAVM